MQKKITLSMSRLIFKRDCALREVMKTIAEIIQKDWERKKKYGKN